MLACLIPVHVYLSCTPCSAAPVSGAHLQNFCGCCYKPTLQSWVSWIVLRLPYTTAQPARYNLASHEEGSGPAEFKHHVPVLTNNIRSLRTLHVALMTCCNPFGAPQKQIPWNPTPPSPLPPPPTLDFISIT